MFEGRKRGEIRCTVGGGEVGEGVGGVKTRRSYKETFACRIVKIRV